jgi:hypothetical protein
MDLVEGKIDDPISHWYYSHKFSIIEKLLENDLESAALLLDVGAGSALFSKELIKQNPKLKCLAVDTGYKDEINNSSNEQLSFHKHLIDKKADIYLFTDVLEHVLDDRSMLLEYTNSAPAGSAILLTVPAHMCLWSGHDVFLKHYRRYSKVEFEKLILSAGLRIEKSQYIFTFLFPFAYLIRKLPRNRRVESQMKTTNILVNFLLKNLLKIELLSLFPKPFGVSVVILARK